MEPDAFHRVAVVAYAQDHAVAGAGDAGFLRIRESQFRGQRPVPRHRIGHSTGDGAFDDEGRDIGVYRAGFHNSMQLMWLCVWKRIVPSMK